MLNISGDFVRRVTSTGHSSGSRSASAQLMTEEDILEGTKEKVNLTIKGTPSKDACTARALGSKSGHLIKRNEQGVWQKRFVSVVPHTFLYYFDSDVAEAPRGVIDLHFYNSVVIEGMKQNILKLSGPDDSNLRPYYFEINDPTALSEWVRCLLQDKYHVIRDERDAYQQLQDQFSGEMNFANKQVELSAAERERLQLEIATSTKALETTSAAMKNLLRLSTEASGEGEVGVREMEAKIKESFETLQRRCEALEEELSTERAAGRARAEKLDCDLAAERQARKLSEANLVLMKRESEGRLREAMAHADATAVNVNMAVSAKNALGTKHAALLEQKKLLVKEVKQLRKKNEESAESIRQLKVLNDRLVTAVAALQKADGSGGEALTIESAGVMAAGTKADAPQEPMRLDAATLRYLDTLGSSLSVQQNGKEERQEQAQGEDGECKESSVSASDQSTAPESAIEGQEDPGGALAALGDEQAEAPETEAETETETEAEAQEAERSSFDLNNVQLNTLANVNAVKERRESDGVQNAQELSPKAHSTVRSISSSLMGTLTFSSPLGVSSGASGTGSGSGSGNGSVRDKDTPQSEGGRSRRTSLGESLGKLSSMLQSSKPAVIFSAEDLQGPDNSCDGNANTSTSASKVADMNASGGRGDVESEVGTGTKETRGTRGQGKGDDALLPFYSSPLAEGAGGGTGQSAGNFQAPRCLRCNGKVEGPKYSTCTCAVPAMNQADLEADAAAGNTGSRLLGMLSTSMNAFGKRS